MARSNANRFARIPLRLIERLQLGEITSDDLGLITVLVAKADHKTRVATFPTLEVLRAELGWHREPERSPSHLRRRLKHLREAGEIDFTGQQGRPGRRRGGDPWQIRVVPDDFFERNVPIPDELTLPATNLDPTANGHGKADSERDRFRQRRIEARTAEQSRDADIDEAEPTRANGNGSGDLEAAIDNLLGFLNGENDSSRGKLLMWARQLPHGLAVVQDLAARFGKEPGVYGVGYAVNALKGEAGETPSNKTPPAAAVDPYNGHQPPALVPKDEPWEGTSFAEILKSYPIEELERMRKSPLTRTRAEAELARRTTTNEQEAQEAV